MLADLNKKPVAGRSTGWNGRSTKQPSPGIAVAVTPCKERTEECRKECPGLFPDEEKVRPAEWTPQWRDALLDGMARILAGRQLPGAWFPAMGVPRFVHGQSQGICDIFGTRVELQPDGNYFVHPLPPDPALVAAVQPRKPATSMYWGALKWIEYARAASRGTLEFRNPVMTGPFDTVNYLLGTTTLMEWVYTEPLVVHGLLDKVTAVIIEVVRAMQRSAGGALHGDILSCISGAFSFCSECRSLVSAEIHEEFEAPYLARIGEVIGPYGIHSCGSWERTILVALRDANLRAMNGQVRENDLVELCRLAAGRIVLSIGPSQNLHERYTWPDRKSFLKHILESTPAGQPLEVCVDESELVVWNNLNSRLGDRGNP